MSDALQFFVIFALIVFCACCVYVAYWFASEVTAALYYRSIREQIREAITEVDDRWAGEPIPPETVTEILVLIHNRRAFIDWDELRERQGGVG